MSRKHKTNVEFLTEVMEFSKHGALMQAFIVQAVSECAEKIAGMKPEEMNTGLVSPHAWHGCAVELQAELKKQYGN